MAKTHQHTPVNEKERPQAGKRERSDEAPLKGTFASVMLLGLFLALTWLGVFLLFIYRG